MKAETLNLAQLFNKPVSFLVPLFQRPYVWEQEKHWQPLWEDIRWVAERLLAERGKPSHDDWQQDPAETRTSPHFLGALVVQQLLSGAGMVDRRRIIDGQQRLTTLQLFLDAAHDVASGLGDDSAKLFRKLTDNDPDLVKELSDTYKVWPTNMDRDSFRMTMRKDEDAQLDYEQAQIEERDISGSSVWRAHEFFFDSISEWLTEDREAITDRLDVLRTVLWNLIKMVVIDLEPNDNPQVIFETLNARGTPLLATDLIKNTLFQSAIDERLDAERLYKIYWASLDQDWWREEVTQGRLKRPRLDIFFAHWLTMRKGAEFGAHELFAEFKKFASIQNGSTEDLLVDIVRYSKVYQSFSTQPPGTLEATFFYRLEAMETTTATPLLLFVFGLSDDVLTRDQRHRVLLAVESWLVRRLLCRMTTKNYNQNFQQLLSLVLKDPSSADKIAVQFLAGLTGESGEWPSDEQLETALLTLPLYKILSRGRIRMVLEALEEALRARHPGYAEAAVPTGLSIEHVLPQSWDSVSWPLPTSEQPELAKQRRDILKHTLGNLTLITRNLNSFQSNLPWEGKRKHLQEFTVLYLNKMFMDDSLTWDEDLIERRGKELASLAALMWPGPQTLLGTRLPERPEPLHIPQRSKAPPSPKPKKDAVGRQKEYQAFWDGFLSLFRSRFPNWGKRREAPIWAAIGFPSGHGGVWYDAHLGKKGLTVDTIIVKPGVFEHLLQQRERIERRFGEPLQWDRKEGKKRSSIGIVREGSVDDTGRWADYQAWFVETLGRLNDAISPELTGSAFERSSDA